MSKNNDKQHLVDDHSSMNLKGTFISVMALGVFILIFWFAIYALFISR